MTTDERVRVLWDKDEIRQQIYNYSRAMDRIDHALGKAIFHPDALADYGIVFQGTGHGFIDWVLKTHRDLVSHAHQLSTISIDVTGDTARSEAYGDNTLCWPDGQGGTTIIRILGRYIDRWERRDNTWRIAHRRYLHDMDYMTSVTTANAQPISGRRDRTDASYFDEAEPAG